MGPFGGAVLGVLVPELQASFHATRDAVAASIPAYLIPFAALQLVSGTIGERLGVTRVVRTGFIGYAVGSLIAAAAPTLKIFVAARFVQGASNAFLTPLLLATLAEIVPPQLLTRAMGTFASVQTGRALAGAADRRAAGRLQLAAGVPRSAPASRSRWRSSRRAPGRRPPAPRARRACAACSRAGWASSAARVPGLRDRRRRRLHGLVLRARPNGSRAARARPRARLLRRRGLRARPAARRGRAGHRARARRHHRRALLGACVAPLGLTRRPWQLAALWTLAGAGSVLLWTGLNTLAVEAVPENRGGATSMFGAFRFAGSALSPYVFLPIYNDAPSTPSSPARRPPAPSSRWPSPIRTLTPEPVARPYPATP